jgi:hypothetical protein
MSRMRAVDSSLCSHHSVHADIENTQQEKMQAQKTDAGSRWTETEQSSRIQAVDKQQQKQSRVAECIQSIVVCTEAFIIQYEAKAAHSYLPVRQNASTKDRYRQIQAVDEHK